MALGLAAGASHFAAALPLQMYDHAQLMKQKDERIGAQSQLEQTGTKQQGAALSTTQGGENQSRQVARSEGIPPQSLPSVGHRNEGQPTGQGQGVRDANRNESNATAMNQRQQTNGEQHLTI